MKFNLEIVSSLQVNHCLEATSSSGEFISHLAVVLGLSSAINIGTTVEVLRAITQHPVIIKRADTAPDILP
eukprot:13579881-Ditylum_brightwellii.AAC.1